MNQITSDQLKMMKFVDGVGTMQVLRTERITVMIAEISSKWYVSLSKDEGKPIQLGTYDHIEEICALLVGLKM